MRTVGVRRRRVERQRLDPCPAVSWRFLAALIWSSRHYQGYQNSILQAFSHRKMRNTLRLLAVVKPGRYLEAGNPTGLTGLFTHPAPRSTLLYLYGATLDKLKTFPEHSVYRQSTEALTKHRMKIIESIRPEGYDEWAKKAAEKIEKFPEAFQPGGDYVKKSAGGQDFVTVEEHGDEDQEWRSVEGFATSEEKSAEAAKLKKGRRQDYKKVVNWQPEPPLEASQYVRHLDFLDIICVLRYADVLVRRISDAENQIGGGLIEEVIQLAEGELKLVETMAESQVYVHRPLTTHGRRTHIFLRANADVHCRWEELEEKPPQGQWDYFARDQHTPGTQEPPNK